MSQRCQQETHAPQQIVKLFDHLVGAGEQRGWQGETEGFRGLKVDYQFKFCRLFDREFPGVSALEYLST
jgi:hypothetical protein